MKKARCAASRPATWRRQGRLAQVVIHARYGVARKYTLFAEGARGSLTKQLIAKFLPRRQQRAAEIRHRPQEVWQIDPAKHQKGLIQHSFGWPLNNSTGGGSFLYHYDENLVAVGFVVHPITTIVLSPFDEFQRFKTHPASAPSWKAASGSPMARGHH